MNGFKIFMFFFILFLNIHFEISAKEDGTIASSLKSSEVDFLFGYQDLLNQNYGEAADKFYSVIIDKPNRLIVNKSYLYLSLSQYKLRNILGSAYNAARVDPKMLDIKDHQIFKKLVKSLGNLYSQALIEKNKEQMMKERRNYFFFPYFGRISYENLPQKESAIFYGLAIETQKKEWSFFAGYESLELQSELSNLAYKQTQFNSGLDYRTEDNSLYFSRVSLITSPLETQNNILMYGLGLEKNISKKNRGILDIYQSHYPNFSEGKMVVNQLDLGLKYTLLEKTSTTIELQPGIQFTKPNFSSKNPDFFISPELFQKYSLDLNIHKQDTSFLFQYWLGEEAFGIRNQGRIIFSGVEKHTRGFSINISSELLKNLKGQFSFINEKITMNKDEGYSNTLLGLIQLMVY